jgi:hypothetical protein
MLEKLMYHGSEKAVSRRKAAVPGREPDVHVVESEVLRREPDVHVVESEVLRREPDVHVVGNGSTWEGTGCTCSRKRKYLGGNRMYM